MKRSMDDHLSPPPSEVPSGGATTPRRASEPIAVVGMACRLPGGADSPEAYWRLLEGGVDAVCEVPAGRFDADACYDPDTNVPGAMCTRRGGFLREPIDRFDAPFFGISPREAQSMDPQHRLLLEVGWEALENAAQAGDRLDSRGRDTGVFVGITSHDYADLHLAGAGMAQADMHRITGNSHNAAAGRLSYCFGFQGPCVAVDTACSSSLVAVHLACRSLLDAECRRALVGGVNLILAPTATIALSQGKVLSPDGRCRAFDAEAAGMGRGEGCAAVLLKRLSHALEDGDDILALIRGSAMNQGGPSSGFTVPNGPAQEALIRRALAVAGLEPNDIDYIEAHGAGTPLGDPIELRALAGVFVGGRDPARPLVVGAVKTNFGHVEACAGLAGLLKVVLSLQHRRIPPHLHWRQPTPHVPWHEWPIQVPTAMQPWPERDAPGRAGVSSFGVSGVNAHVVLEQAPPAVPPADAQERSQHLLVVSGRSEAALRHSARRFAEHFEHHPDTSPGDACRSAATGRAHANHRLGVVGASLSELRGHLAAFAAGQTDEAGCVHFVAASTPPKIAFMFTGQGAQYAGMGRALYEAEPVFRQTLDRCAEILRPRLPCPLTELLYGTPASASLDDTACTQPALFAVEFALAALWRSWGVEPALVLGHSLGEYVAACVAGVFSLEDALRLVTERGRLMQGLPRDGAVLSVEAALEDVEPVLRPHAAELAIAAVNGPANVVVSGHADAVAAIEQTFASLGQRTERLRISHASHSPLMDPVLDEFERCVASFALSPPQLPLISNLDPAIAPAALATATYWRRHLRGTVRFADGVAAARERGCSVFIEIGPRAVLTGLAQRAFDDAGADVAWLPSLRSSRPELQQMLESLAGAYVRGVPVDWGRVYQGRRGRRVALPTTPFQRERCWLERPVGQPGTGTRMASASQSGHPLLGYAIELAASPERRFEAFIGPQSPAFLQDHRVFDEAVLPASGILEMAVAAFGGDAAAIENVSFERALHLPAGQARAVQTVLRPDPARDETFAFEIHSRDASGTGWTRHAAGTLRRLVPGDGAGDVQGAPRDIAGLVAEAGAAVDVESLYRRARDRGVVFGPRFQALRRVWRHGDTAFGEIALPPLVENEARAYRLHPVLLDAALQVINGIYADRDEPDVYVPAALDRLRVYKRAGAAGWSRVLAHPLGNESERGLRVDVDLLDPDGGCVARIEGLCLKRADDAQWRAAACAAGFADWLYQVAWPVDRSVPAAAPPRLQGRRWLILAPMQSALADALQRRIVSEGDSATLVRPAPGTALCADFDRLLTGGDAPARIVNLWPTDAAACADPAEASRLGCEAALQLVQAVARSGVATPPELWFVTQQAQPLGERPTLAGMLQAPVAGFAKAAALEHPELRIVCADVDDIDAADAARALHEQMERAPDGETEIALRGGERHVARLVRHPTGDPRPPVAIRADATYLVTGGLGGLGLETARWLVARGARSVVLVGRSAATQSTAGPIEHMRRDGASVVCMQADVADAAQLERVLADIDAGLPPLRGVVHAAGVLEDGILAHQTPERLRAVLAPKLLGGWHLHRLTRERHLDFFVLYSSLASVLGSAGQAGYVAANTFLDSLSHHRRALGLPALTINWGPWSAVGLAVRRGVEARTSAQGLGSISPAQGMRVLEHLLGGTATQVGVAPIDWPSFFSRSGVARIPPFFAGFAGSPGVTTLDDATPNSAGSTGKDALREALANATPAERAERLAVALRAQVASVLRLPVDEVDSGRPLNRIGLDSLMAVELRNRLRSHCGLDVPLVRFMEDKSICELAASLGDAPDDPVPASGKATLLARLDALTDDEVDALLDAALSGSTHRLP